MPKVPAKILEAGGTLLKELDAPSSVAEFANVQAKLESDTKDTADKMEGGCLREFTRFLEKEVHATRMPRANRTPPHTRKRRIVIPSPISQP